ncbi:MAG: hypothetical protein A3F13_00020 [Gammaproteobacteria bacterium RIFCSPHIGHO2_12_FULL_40_19]|nr:MAG: hypothetical protein A3F13_00020 [Gammaproteobacteria bacterium RIFCSPHIGHO2_12_FULL_40_19]
MSRTSWFSKLFKKDPSGDYQSLDADVATGQPKPKAAQPKVETAKDLLTEAAPLRLLGGAKKSKPDPYELDTRLLAPEQPKKQ